VSRRLDRMSRLAPRSVEAIPDVAALRSTPLPEPRIAVEVRRKPVLDAHLNGERRSVDGTGGRCLTDRRKLW